MKRLFISYTEADKDLFEELVQQLSPLQKAGIIMITNDQNIDAGVDMVEAIKQQMHQSDIVLMLLSADSLSSDIVMIHEMPLAVELHDAGKTKLIPLIGRACMWDETPLSHITPLPESQLPITSKHWDSPDEPYLNIAKRIRDLIEGENNAKEDEGAIEALKKVINEGGDADDFALFYRHRNKDFFLPEDNHQLGWFYQMGKGCPVNFEAAFNYYKKAAEQGYGLSFFNMGLMYENGLGVQVDYKKAFECFKNGAERGSSSAQNQMGNMYYDGRFVVQNYEIAKEWYLKAAEQESKYAQLNLGNMYLHGYGVAKNKKTALKWYKLSAAQGYEPAIKHLKELEEE